MPRVDFKPTTPAFQRTLTVHVLDRAAIVVRHHVFIISELSHIFNMYNMYKTKYLYGTILHHLKVKLKNSVAFSP
jgi:hypothetical protein